MTVSGTPERLGTNPVPDGVNLVIKAKAGNAGTVTIGHDSAHANHDGTGYFSLAANQSLGIDVDNLNDVWIDATVTGDGVEYVFERQLS